QRHKTSCGQIAAPPVPRGSFCCPVLQTVWPRARCLKHELRGLFQQQDTTHSRVCRFAGRPLPKSLHSAAYIHGLIPMLHFLAFLRLFAIVPAVFSLCAVCLVISILG